METPQNSAQNPGFSSSPKTHMKYNSKPPKCGPIYAPSPTLIPTKKRPFVDPYSPENYTWWRKASASKTKPKTYVKIKKTPPHKTEHTIKFHDINSTGGAEREKVKEKLAMFRGKCEELSRITTAERGTHRIDFKALVELKKQGKLPSRMEVVTGSIPGVKIGDRFDYRVELMIVGLHRRSQHGIDYGVMHGNLVATCIVSTEGYEDKVHDHHEVLSYVGEGGKVGQCVKDQRLEGGNLALKNSMDVGNDVRVVRGVKFGTRFGNNPRTMYVYDGLYKVVGMKEKRGDLMNLVYEFTLRRNPNQVVVPWHRFKCA